MPQSFPYVGKALTPAEFADYVAGYNFGPTPPDFVVLHHTAIPGASWAPGGDPRKWWDAGERSMTLDQKREKRLGQLHNLMMFYRDTLGWSAGPHLFIDDLFIYLMTPMFDIGIHAMWGNSFRRDGKLHYSIGIEVIGNYAKTVWPEAVQNNVRAAVQTLQARLKTFTLDYMYSDGARPGRARNLKSEWYCPKPERLRFGGLSSHRDYNKPECPGDAITEAFYLAVIRGYTHIPPADRVGTRYVVRPRVTASIRIEPRQGAREVERRASGADVWVVDSNVPGEKAGNSAIWYKLADGNYVHSSGVVKA